MINDLKKSSLWLWGNYSRYIFPAILFATSFTLANFAYGIPWIAELRTTIDIVLALIDFILPFVISIFLGAIGFYEALSLSLTTFIVFSVLQITMATIPYILKRNYPRYLLPTIFSLSILSLASVGYYYLADTNLSYAYISAILGLLAITYLCFYRVDYLAIIAVILICFTQIGDVFAASLSAPNSVKFAISEASLIEPSRFIGGRGIGSGKSSKSKSTLTKKGGKKLGKTPTTISKAFEKIKKAVGKKVQQALKQATKVEQKAFASKLKTKYSEAKKRKKFAKNKQTGEKYENKKSAEYKKSRPNTQTQVTIKTKSGTRTRIDIISRNPNGKLKCVECKSSESAKLTPNQKKAFPEIKKSGGIIVGAGKHGFEGGTKLPPTRVHIVRPKKK